MSSFDEWKQEGVPWDETPDLWELQTGPHLTVGHLMELLARVDPALPVRVGVYEGTGPARLLDPVEVGYVGQGSRPDALVMTVTPLAR